MEKGGCLFLDKGRVIPKKTKKDEICEALTYFETLPEWTIWATADNYRDLIDSWYSHDDALEIVQTYNAEYNQDWF